MYFYDVAGNGSELVLYFPVVRFAVTRVVCRSSCLGLANTMEGDHTAVNIRKLSFPRLHHVLLLCCFTPGSAYCVGLLLNWTEQFICRSLSS